MKPGGRSDHPVELLSASIDRELQPSETSALEAHLEGCAGCRGLLVDFRRLGEALADDFPPAVPAGLGARIMAQVRERPAAAPAPFWRQAMPLAAAASLLMAVLLWYGRPDRLPPMTGPVSASAPEPTAATSAPEPAASAPGAASIPAPVRLDRAAPAGPAPTPPAPPSTPGDRSKDDLAKTSAKEAKGIDADSQWKVEQAPAAPPLESHRTLNSGAETDEVAAGAEDRGRTAAALEERNEAEKQRRLMADEAAKSQVAAQAAPEAPAPGIVARLSAPAPVMASVPRVRPVGLFAAPYIVTLEGERQMRVERSAYVCSVPIEERDAKLVAASIEEIVRVSGESARVSGSAAGAAAGAAPRLPAIESTGAIVVTATPQARESILRLVRERYRRVLESRCGPLPE